MTRFIIPVLCTLFDSNAFTECDAMTINELLDTELCEAYSYSSIYRACCDLQGCGLLAFGLLSNNANTYYLTKKGIDYCKSRKLV